MRILLCLVLSLVTTRTHALMVISDVDDTVKITNSGSTWQSTWNGLFKNAVYGGMPEVYRAWGKEKAIIYFVTGSPFVVGKTMRSMFAHHKIPYVSVTLRTNMLEDTYKYKMRVITKLMNRHPEEDVILVGDDTTKDQMVYRDIAAKFPGRVLETYIHRVKNRVPVEGQVNWLTAFDIADYEQRQGRLKSLSFVKVTAAVLNATSSKLFPHFAYCPAEIDGLDIPTVSSSETEAQHVEEKIEKICSARL